MPFDAGSLLSFLKLDTKGFSSGLVNAKGKVNQFDSSVGKSDKTLKSMSGTAAGLGKLMLTGLGFFAAFKAVTAFTGAIGDSIGMAADLEKSMANVATLVDTTVVSMDGLTDSVLEMTSEVLKSAEDLSVGLYQVFSAGVTDSAEAMEVLRISAIAATAGLATTLTSVDAITTILNAYGLEAKEATEISDLMFQTVKLGKTTFDQLAQAIGTVISPAASVGIELDELFASLATLTKGGINTMRATTALRATLLAVIKPTDQAKEAAKKLELEWTVAALKAKGLVQFLSEIREATGGSTEAIAELFPNVRALNAVLALSGKQFEELIDIQKQFEDRSGSTIEALKKQEDTYESQKVKLGLMVDEIQTKIGQTFIPALNAMLQGIITVFNTVGEELDELNGRLGPLAERMKSVGESTRLAGQGIDLSIRKVNEFVKALKTADIDLIQFFAKSTTEQQRLIQALGLPKELIPRELQLPSLPEVDIKGKERIELDEKQIELLDELILKSKELGKTELEIFDLTVTGSVEKLQSILDNEQELNDRQKEGLMAIFALRQDLRNQEELKAEEQAQKEIDRAKRIADAKARSLKSFNRAFENAGKTQLQILGRDQAKALAREGLTAENKKQIVKFFAEKETLIKQQEQQKQLQAAGTFATATGDLASNLNQILLNSGKKGSRELFLIMKVAAIAQAIVNTAVAVTRALAELGPVLGPPAAFALGAAGAAQVGVIVSTVLKEGGLVTGPTTALVGEEGPEAVIPIERGVAPIIEESVKNVVEEEGRPGTVIMNFLDMNLMRATALQIQAETGADIVINTISNRNLRTSIGENTLSGVL